MKSYTSLDAIQQDLIAGNLTCKALVASLLEKIEKNKHLNAFLEVYEDEAVHKAEAIDQKIRENKAGKLAGLIIGIKDNICYKGHKVSAASKILKNFSSLYSATAVERLENEDAIVIGRLNCDEFAMGSSNENSAFGNVLNPLDNSKVPGGSSGGSAVAVKMDLCHAALGSDTGGSIRQPSSFCGVVGVKPTYGRISRYGLIAYASSFDQIGPLTKNVKDAALMVEIMAGKDDYDSTVSTRPVMQYSQNLDFKKKAKIAVFKECLESEGLDKEVKQRVIAMVDQLKEDGHTVDYIQFPYLDYLVPAYYILTTAEASSNLSRYDGIHYGYRSQEATDIDSTFKKSRTEGFGTEVKRRIMLGTFVLSAGYKEAYYEKAQKVRKMIRETTLDVLSKYDFIMLPTTPHTAFKIGENIKDPISMYLEDIFTVQANLTGVPAISLPLGTHTNQMPFGIQLMAGLFKETELFSFSRHLINNY